MCPEGEGRPGQGSSGQARGLRAHQAPIRRRTAGTWGRVGGTVRQKESGREGEVLRAVRALW